jgi:hypothetical protein
MKNVEWDGRLYRCLESNAYESDYQGFLFVMNGMLDGWV